MTEERRQSAGTPRLDRAIFADLVAAVMLSALAFGAVEPWSIALFELNALFVAVLLAVRFALGAPWKLPAILLPPTGLLVWGAAQLVPLGSLGGGPLSQDPHATGQAVLRLLALLIYFFAAVTVLRTSARRRLVFVLLTVFGFAVSLFAILQRLTDNGKMYWVRTVSANIAPYGPFGNYNHFAGFVELLLPLPLAWLLTARIRIEQRVLSLLAVAIMAVAVIFSLSRGGMLAIGVEILLLLLLARRARGESASVDDDRRLLVPALLVAIVLLALWIGYDRLLQRFNVTRQGTEEYSLVTRAEYWRNSWRMFLDHPIAGVGLGAFPAVYPAYGRSTAKFERLEQTHNDYLQLLTDAGVVGGLLGLWFVAELALAVKRRVPGLARVHGRERAALLGGFTAIAGLLVHSFTDFNLQIPSNALLFLFVLALAISVEPGDK
ncbi:MAG: O-antigen ligase family protein [Blastocatellia bacterium]|nr:O-antigen ligase family protein [Blastocatellia bacterium]